MTGTIKTLKEKGFGFISSEGSADIFFHMNHLVGVQFEELREGDTVSFDKENGDKGISAVNVQRA
jgi:CspA family cold shock protein